MKLSLLFSTLTAPIAVAALVGCSHPQSRAPAENPSLTSATMTRTSPPSAQPGAVERFRPAAEVSAQPDESVAIEMWSDRYPDAAGELLDWMGHYPNAAAELSTWDSASPIQMKALVDWSLTHRYEGLGSFLFGRSGMHTLHEIQRVEPEAMNEFLGWIRRSPHAAEELYVHADALAWASKHLKPRAGHQPMAARSVVAPTAAVTRSSAPVGIAPPSTSAWYPTPTSMVR
jgi:hypothetical protein